MVAAVAQPEPRIHVQFEVRGNAARLWDNPTGEIVIAGPRGTGKTRAILEWVHWRCQRERLRVLFLRKTLEDLKTSALVTYQEQVLYNFDGRRSDADGVNYFGGNKLRPAQFTYETTGSVIVVGGLDNPARALSTEYDIIYINEAIELTLDQWERLTGSTDRPKLGPQRPPSLVLGDCNPDAPTHWIKQREAEGKLQLWPTTHRDNPAMWNRIIHCWTEGGLRYLARLRTMTGVRRLRFLLGLWVAAEGQVYEGWDPAIHVIDPFPIPALWPRYWSLDFGFTNAFCWQAFAKDPDGRLYLYREIYMSGRLVEDHALQVRALTSGDPRPTRVVADHDAEGRATFERYAGVDTEPAHKAVREGIQAVAARLRPAGDGSPRLFIMRGCTVERDAERVAKGLPASTEEEFPSYVWDTSNNRNHGEEPVKENDHGMDGCRYLVCDVDGIGAEDDTVRVGSYLGRRGEGE